MLIAPYEFFCPRFRSELPHLVELMDNRMEELKLDMMPADNIDEVIMTLWVISSIPLKSMFILDY